MSIYLSIYPSSCIYAYTHIHIHIYIENNTYYPGIIFFSHSAIQSRTIKFQEKNIHFLYFYNITNYIYSNIS